MDQRGSEGNTVREPIRSRWAWFVIAALVLGSVPLYLPVGTVLPLVFGVPYWMALSVVATLLFAALTSWLCLRRWNLVEPEEERERLRQQHAAEENRGNEGGSSWTN